MLRLVVLTRKQGTPWWVRSSAAGLTLTLTLLAGLTSSAQQDNRQLKREQTPTRGTSQRRIALVIGNGAYQHVKQLKNPTNDAALLATTLRKLGFDVLVETDRSQVQMKRLIREFGRRLREAGGVGVFYFAGHGVQARGVNYLIPVDAEIQLEADLEDAGVNLNFVLNTMDDAQNTLNIAILDACRDNPFPNGSRSASVGLAQVRAPTGTLIAYATAPDSVAADGHGANSPYAEELTKQMQVSGVLLETMFRRVAEEVSSRSGGRQEPWYSANVKGDFFFGGKPSASNQTEYLNQTIDAAAFELSYWESIRTSNDPEDFRSYLERYPNGSFTELARRRATRTQPPTVKKTGEDNNNPNNTSATEAKPTIAQADELLRQREFAAARNAAKLLLQSHPTNPQVWRIAGFAALNLKQYSEAAVDLQKAVEMESRTEGENLNTISALAQAYVLSESYERALPLLVRVTNQPGSKPDHLLLYYRGIAEYKTGNHQNAEISFNAVLKLEPKDSLSLFYLAQIAIAKNDLDGAIAVLNRATSNDARLTGAWVLLTAAHLRRAARTNDTAKEDADYLSAVRAGENLVKLRGDQEALTLFGQALLGAKQFARAVVTLERAVGTDANAVTFYLLGIAYSRTNNFSKAITVLQTAATKSPEDVNIYRELGYAYEMSKQYSKALEAYLKGSRMAPDDAYFKESITRVRPFAQ